MNTNALIVPSFGSTAVAEFGNKTLKALVMASAVETEATAALAAADKAKRNIQFEMARAIFQMALEDDKLNPYAIEGKNKEVRALNTRILVKMGVMEQYLEGDEIRRKWTDPEVEALYAVSESLKETDKAEYERREANWRKLTVNFSNGAKLACQWLDLKLKAEDVTYTEVDGVMLPTIKKAPSEIQGTAKGPVVLGAKKPREGATLSPTINSLLKVQNDKAPKKRQTNNAADTKTDAKMGASDEMFIESINNAIRFIRAQENKFTAGMIASLKTLVADANAAIKTGASLKSE